jgi:hypothetical protein
MCRSIKTLRQPEGLPDEDEIQAAALQYVRKVSGYRKPSRANQAAFDLAVAQIAEATRVLLDGIQTRGVSRQALPAELPAWEDGPGGRA